MENYIADYLPYLRWETETPLQAILIAGEASATCPPRARQWAACRLLVDTLGGTVSARYAPTEDRRVCNRRNYLDTGTPPETG